MGAGRVGRLLGKRHLAGGVAAAALGGVVILQLSPNFLRQLRAVRFILGRCVQFAAQVAPDFAVGLDMSPHARNECRRYVAIAATGLDPEHVGEVWATGQFLVRLPHLMTRGAKRIRFRIFYASRKTGPENDASAEGNQRTGGNSKQPPSLWSSPKPREESAAQRRRGDHSGLMLLDTVIEFVL